MVFPSPMNQHSFIDSEETVTKDASQCYLIFTDLSQHIAILFVTKTSYSHPLQKGR